MFGVDICKYPYDHMSLAAGQFSFIAASCIPKKPARPLSVCLQEKMQATQPLYYIRIELHILPVCVNMYIYIYINRHISYYHSTIHEMTIQLPSAAECRWKAPVGHAQESGPSHGGAGGTG